MESLSPSSTPQALCGLRDLRLLFLLRQYRRCIQLGDDLLRQNCQDSSPYHDAIIKFYQGLACDDMARAMHNFSQAKIPTFDKAVQCYCEAIAILSFKSNKSSIAEEQSVGREADVVQLTSHYSWESISTSKMTAHPNAQPNQISRSATAKSETSTPYQERSISKTEVLNSGRTENHGRPYLERDFSCISLLDTAEHQPKKVEDRYHGPFGAIDQPSYVTQRSSLETLELGTDINLPISSVVAQIEVKRLGMPKDPPWLTSTMTLDRSTVLKQLAHGLPPIDSFRQIDKSNNNSHLIDMHVVAVRQQLERHMELAGTARQAAAVAQAERVAKSLGDKTNPPTTYDSRYQNDKQIPQPLPRVSDGGSQTPRLPHLKSFWSFTTQSQKESEKRKRLQAGRERLWVRPRFDNRKYVALSEAAIAEL